MFKVYTEMTLLILVASTQCTWLYQNSHFTLAIPFLHLLFCLFVRGASLHDFAFDNIPCRETSTSSIVDSGLHISSRLPIQLWLVKKTRAYLFTTVQILFQSQRSRDWFCSIVLAWRSVMCLIFYILSTCLDKL